ncbi:hypothetical protein JCM8547_009127 [Rhodosporidiobolus lusitaniae]
MPPRPFSSTTTKPSPTLTSSPTPLSLPQLISLLSSSSHLTAHQAIALCRVLVPKGYTSHAKLRTLGVEDLKRLGVEDEEVRAAWGRFRAGGGGAQGKGKGKGKQKEGNEGMGEGTGDGMLGQLGEGQQKKRKRPARERDLDRPLPWRATERDAVEEDFDFDEIWFDEALAKKMVLTNRAPVMTAWSFIVAERLGFRRQEALSIAHVLTDMNATSKGVSLGILPDGRHLTEVGSSQPFVEILGRKVPVLSTQNGEWRAISKGVVADPGKAFAYVKGAFRQQMGAVVGAMRLLAESFTPADLNKKGYGLYLSFRPEVEGWGKKGELRMSTILDLRPLEPPADVLKEEEDGEGQTEVKIEQEEYGEQGREKKRVKVEAEEGGKVVVKKEEEGEQEDVKPTIPEEQKPKEEDEGDEYDEFDEGIDFSAIPL